MGNKQRNDSDAMAAAEASTAATMSSAANDSGVIDPQTSPGGNASAPIEQPNSSQPAAEQQPNAAAAATPAEPAAAAVEKTIEQKLAEEFGDAEIDVVYDGTHGPSIGILLLGQTYYFSVGGDPVALSGAAAARAIASKKGFSKLEAAPVVAAS